MKKFSLCLLFVCWIGQPVHAALTIEITQGVEGALPIAVVPFTWPNAGPVPEDIAAIVSADLRRSGRFVPLAEADLLSRPVMGEAVDYQSWRVAGIDHLVVGQLQEDAPGQFTLQFQLLDALRGEQLTGYSIRAATRDLRRVAHQVSDIIFEEITGQAGAFDTHIAYVTAENTETGKHFSLQVADSDGYDPQTILESDNPIMSPAWSPDGRQLAYVSFEKGRAEIFVQDVESNRRQPVSSHAGVNGAPAWSPDGNSLALALSKDGNLEIYVLHLPSRALRRITQNAGIDTEPVWAPDGKSLVFTSDRGGGPQLYQVELSGGRPQRLTFEGSYNASADFAPDGQRLAMVHRLQGAFRIAVLDLNSGLLRLVTEGKLDESPSFAPNGSMILYGADAGFSGVLAAASADGRFHQRLVLRGGDVREPAWSPRLGR